MSEPRPRLTSAFSFGGPMLMHARARLYSDRVELSGWQFKGRYRQTIPLGEILQIDAPRKDELLLWLADGKTLRLRLPYAFVWRDLMTDHPPRWHPTEP